MYGVAACTVAAMLTVPCTVNLVRSTVSARSYVCGMMLEGRRTLSHGSATLAELLDTPTAVPTAMAMPVISSTSTRPDTPAIHRQRRRRHLLLQALVRRLGVQSISSRSAPSPSTSLISPASADISNRLGPRPSSPVHVNGADLVVSYPDPDSHSCGWITSRSGDVIHPQLWESGSGYETTDLESVEIELRCSGVDQKAGRSTFGRRVREGGRRHREWVERERKGEVSGYKKKKL